LELRLQLGDVDLQHLSSKLVVVETPFGDDPGERHLSSREPATPRGATAAEEALVPATSRLAVSGPRAPANALPLLAFCNSAMDVVDNHEISSPRSRATSSRVRNRERASN